jgi:hypothetical protein
MTNTLSPRKAALTLAANLLALALFAATLICMGANQTHTGPISAVAAPTRSTTIALAVPPVAALT